MLTENQRAWRLLAAMARIALDTDAELPLFRHLIHRTTLARSWCRKNYRLGSAAHGSLSSASGNAEPVVILRLLSFIKD